MSATGGGRRRVSRRVRRNRAVAVLIAAVLVIGGVTVAIATAVGNRAARDAATAADGTAPVPQSEQAGTPADQLLAQSDDPNACAVTFVVDGAEQAPMLQTQGALYAGLPIPARDGLVFAGWYATEADAAGFTIPGRVNGSELVSCVDRRITLHGAWKTPEENAAEDAQIPILMYHQFTDRPDGLAHDDPNHWLAANYAYVGDFDAHMAYIAENDFYLPTWDELAAFIDGRLFLPTHSVVITDDDADQTWFDLAAPVVAKHELLATSFMITAYRQDPPPNPWVLRRSHTHDMHQAGANGKGRIVNWTPDEIAADLEASAAALGGVKEVIAYPFGHYNDTAKQGVAQAGFELARTIEPGYVHIGSDKLALPVVRINYGMGVDYLASQIG